MFPFVALACLYDTISLLAIGVNMRHIAWREAKYINRTHATASRFELL